MQLTKTFFSLCFFGGEGLIKRIIGTICWNDWLTRRWNNYPDLSRGIIPQPGKWIITFIKTAWKVCILKGSIFLTQQLPKICFLFNFFVDTFCLITGYVLELDFYYGRTGKLHMRCTACLYHTKLVTKLKVHVRYVGCGLLDYLDAMCWLKKKLDVRCWLVGLLHNIPLTVTKWIEFERWTRRALSINIAPNQLSTTF